MKAKRILLVGSLVLLIAFLGALNWYNAREKHYDIPRLYIKGNISDMQDKSDIRKVTVEYRDNTQIFTAFAKLKVQGASSSIYEKKNYSIKLYSDKKHKLPQTVDFGWGAQSKYCLKANWIDKTHARNIVTARLAAEIQEKYNVLNDAPNHGLVDGFPIEIYSNGEFLGLYTLNIPKDAWMLGMEENEKNLAYFSGDWELSNLFRALPSEDEAWRQIVGQDLAENWEKLDRVFDFVLKSTDAEFQSDFENYLDIDACFAWIIVANFAQLEDNLGKNTVLATFNGKKWYPCLYDMDTSWGGHWTGKKLQDYKFLPEQYDEEDQNLLFCRLVENFGQELSERYFELRRDILTKEHVMELFHGFRACIPEDSFKRERNKWFEIPGYDYDQIEEFLDVRIPVVDRYMKEVGNSTKADQGQIGIS